MSYVMVFFAFSDMMEGVNKVPFFTLTCKRKLAVAPNEQVFVRNDC
jgi:hypothetical protein